MADLKPCPFCGGEAREWCTPVELGMLYKVECAECHAATSYMKDDEKAIILWNDRVENESYILHYVKYGYMTLMEVMSRVRELEKLVKKE